ncbi:Uncharacterised protein [Mycobacteroides abscessus subsp. abscessus]|nr:Uncharacterised protein [Mycobacteroides abscessus subsp. abscessus]
MSINRQGIHLFSEEALDKAGMLQYADICDMVRMIMRNNDRI